MNNTPLRPPGLPTGAASSPSAHNQDPNQENSLSGLQYNPEDPAAQRRNFQSLINTVAVQRLENELKDYIWKIPFQELPTYSGGPQPSPQRMHAPDEEPSPPRSREDVSRKVYSRSAVQRYVLQRLAADLNKTEEVKRDFHDYTVFRDVLNAPEAPNLNKLDPNVTSVERQRTMSNSIEQGGRREDVFAPGPSLSSSHQEPHTAASSGSQPALSPGMFTNQSHSVSPGSHPHQHQGGAGASTSGQNTPPSLSLGASHAMNGSTGLNVSGQFHKPAGGAGGGYRRGPRQVLDMSNFGTQRGEYLVYNYH